MTFRQTAIQALLAVAALLFAYSTWQRGPELAPDEVVVVDAVKKDLVSARFDDGEKLTWVELTPSSDEAGPFVSVHLGPQTKPATAPATGETKTPARLVRGSDAADKLLARFAPLRASRGLGALGAPKLKDLGLASTKKRITVSLLGGKRVFAVTPSPPGGSEPYLRDEASGQVYVVPRAILSDFETAATLLVERRAHAFRLEEADRLTVLQGTTRHEFVITRSQDVTYLAPMSMPDKPDAVFKTWHDRVFALWPVEVLGKGEIPSEGAPHVELRIDYNLRGRHLGYLEIAKIAASAEGSKDILFARSERSLGWLKLSADARTILDDVRSLWR
jgi:hypothetical protein